MSRFHVKKVLSPDKGYSCVFRQPFADSHCRFLHGYDLRVIVELSCEENRRTKEGWVYDFGKFKEFRRYLDHMLDHTLLVSENDPQARMIAELGSSEIQIAQIRWVRDVGCEALSQHLYEEFRLILNDAGFEHVRIDRVTVEENGSNSAGYSE